VTLAARINSTTTTITVNDGSLLPADDGNPATIDFTVLIDKEVLAVTDVVGNTLTVIRAQGGTTAKSHSNGRPVIANVVLLATAVNDTATTLTVTDASPLPADDGNPATTDFFVRIDKEILAVTDVVGNTLTVVRAQGGTEAASHAKLKQLVTGSGDDQAVKTTSSVAVALDAASTSLVVPDANVFPAAPFSITIDSEEILVTAVTVATRTLTITRAQNGTVAAAHAIGATIRSVTNSTSVAGRVVPEGWLVMPHDSPMAGTPITAAEVQQIIDNGIIVAGEDEAALGRGLTDDERRVRAAIRLEVKRIDLTTFDPANPTDVSRVRTNPGAGARMVLAVADEDGNVLGLYRMHDSTIFSIDVAVAKARNTAYYASNDLQAIDQVDDDNDGVADVPLNTAFTNRTFRFLAEPRYPQGVDGSRPGDFSILNEQVAGVDVFQTEFLKSKNPNVSVKAVENNPALGAVAASAFETVFGFDSFNPGRNFRDPNNIANQNGIIFFPGSTPLYGGAGGDSLIGGYGISGDGVDQDDVVTFFGAQGFLPPDSVVSADDIRIRNARLPYQKFNRNPFG
jgi:uncharacterized protein GlcG (DUF336 family)